MIRKLVLLFLILVLSVGCAQATDYYVSTTGNNSAAGGIDTPWADPAYAATQAVAGDTIYLREGTWNDLKVSFVNNGTSEAPITMKNYPGESPQLNGTSTVADSADMGLDLTNNEWIIVDGLDVYKYTHPLYARYSRNITVRNCKFHDSVGGFAAGISGGPTNYDMMMEYCEIYNSGWNGVQISGDNWLNQPAGLQSTNITVRNCVIHDNNAHNSVDLYGELGHIIIENNTIYNSTYNGIYSHDGTHIDDPDIQSDVIIQNNTIYNTTNGIKVENIHDSLFVGNNITQMTSFGIYAGIYSDNVTVRNNTISAIGSTSSYQAIQVSVSNMLITQNTLTGTNKIIRMGVIGPHSVQDENSQIYECNYIDGNVTGNITYTNGRVVTITNPQSGRYLSYTPVVYTSTGTYWDIVSKSGYTPSVTVTAYNYSAKPAVQNATITPRAPVGSELLNFTAESTNGNAVTFTAWSLTPGYQYRIKEDGVEKSTQLANETGQISWVNSEWSSHVYTVEETGLRLPVAAFTANETDGTAPLDIQFTDNSTQSPTSWAWDFDGDSEIDSTEQNPVWTYDTDGNYTVSLTVANALGSDTETKTGYIKLTNPYVAPAITLIALAAVLFMRARRRW